MLKKLHDRIFFLTFSISKKKKGPKNKNKFSLSNVLTLPVCPFFYPPTSGRFLSPQALRMSSITAMYCVNILQYMHVETCK